MSMTLDEAMAELAALEDPKVLAVNQRHGDEHAVNLTKLRALAKRIKANPALARELWQTDDAAARLKQAGHTPNFDGRTLSAMDPWNNEIRLTVG